MSDIYLGDICAAAGMNEQETAECLEKLLGPGGAWASLVTERHADHVVLRAVGQVEMLELLASWHPNGDAAA
jgi:hypothetical protein